MKRDFAKVSLNYNFKKQYKFKELFSQYFECLEISESSQPEKTVLKSTEVKPKKVVKKEEKK